MLPLERLREIIEYNPFHFYGLANDLVPVTSACNSIVREYAWQGVDAAGRADMRRAIQVAEDKLTRHLGFAPYSKYITETSYISCFIHDPRFVPTAIKLQSGRVESIGTETWASVGLGAVTLTDDDDDGILDSFSAEIADSTNDPSNIAVAFQVDYLPRAAKSKDLEARLIQPVYVERVDAATIRVSGCSWLLVAPKRYEGAVASSDAALDPNDETVYVANLEFFVKSTAGANKVVMNWFDAGGVAQSRTLDAYLADPVNGFVALPNAQQCLYEIVAPTCTCNVRNANSITINYRAGAAPDEFESVIVYLALAELRRRVCACDEANREIYAWQADLALPIGAGMPAPQIDSVELANPFGTRAGQLEAWRRVMTSRKVNSIVI